MFLNLASKFRLEAVQDILATVRIHEYNLTKQLRIKAANEVIEIVSSFESNPKAKKAIQRHKASLAIAYFREGRLKDFFYSISSISILKILIERMINRFGRKRKS